MSRTLDENVGIAFERGHLSAAPRFAVSAVSCDAEHPHSDACCYQVAWSINPHMAPGQVDAELAGQQHARLLTSLREAGAEVTALPFVHGAFDSVFAKDNALLLDTGSRRNPARLALLGRPRFPERLQEQGARERALNALGFEVFRSPCELEGGDIVMLPHGSGALLGHGFRSSPQAVRLLEAFLGAPVLPLELVDEHLYHLDTAAAALDDGTVLLCEEAFRPESLRALHDFEPVKSLLQVPRAEALRFGVNLVQVRDTVILGGHAPVVEAMLRLKGLHPVVVPLDQFQLAGGSAACLVSRVHSLERVASSVTTASRSTSRYGSLSSSSPNTSGSSSS